MAQVIRQQNESIERQISRLRRVMLRSGKLKQVRKNKYFRRNSSKHLIRQAAAFREERRKGNFGG